MGFYEKLLKTIDLELPDKKQESIEKGHEFERYVAHIFSKDKDFSIEQMTYDYFNKTDGIKVESNLNPDLIIRFNPTGEKFAVECKYRSHTVKSDIIIDYVIKWSKPEQIKRYNEFSKTHQIPVFVVIGLSGKPNHPGDMFCLPLEVAKYPEIFPSVLERFRRSPGEPFFWRDGTLK
jgi:hypothetical protein